MNEESLKEDTVSLAGPWRFEIAGADAEGFKRELPGTIRLPGTMDDAGLGPKNSQPPNLVGPYRLYDYKGPAWYQRTIEIPSGWHDKRLTLLLERCRWVTRVWLDERLIGSQNSLIAPHHYELGTGLAPGRYRLTLCVDNTETFSLGDIVSVFYGGTWGNMNGVVGRLELGATPPVWLDAVNVYPDVAAMTALVKVRIGNATGKAGSGVLSVADISRSVDWDAEGGEAEVEIDMSGAKLWDEFAPNLSTITVSLGEDTRSVTFGMRAFAVKGTQFTLNGRPLFLRGTTDSSVWPLTGYPPTDVPAWQRIYRIMKSYGLNHLRCHSWCPPEAAFAAADLEGILIQPEGPQANINAGHHPERDAFMEAELKRVQQTYGNHPSFCTMTLGNEYAGDEEVLSGWMEMLIKGDPRHLYASATSMLTPPNRQWTQLGTGRGVAGPDTMHDLRAVVASDPRPIVGHEIGQWTFWPDSREIEKWTGVMALKSFELVRDDLQRKGILDQERAFVDACGLFACLLYKEEIELLLRTPGYAGFSLLDLHDGPTQGTALVGPLDAFWDSKGFVAPETWRQFCSATVPLLRMPKRIYTAHEPFLATVELAHYGPGDLLDIHPSWTIRDEAGRIVATGTLSVVSAPTGRLTCLGEVNASLAAITEPSKLTVTVRIEDTCFANTWNIWVYPSVDRPCDPPAGVVVCRQWHEARRALAAGQKVVYFPLEPNNWHSLNGRFLPVFWTPVENGTPPNAMGIVCDPKHALFALFPTDGHSDWQWYDLMQHSRMFILDDAPPEFRPILGVVDNFQRNHNLGIIFECRVGRGQLLVCGFDLPSMTECLTARQLLAGMYAYIDTSHFNPTRELESDLLDILLGPAPPNTLKELGATVSASSVAGDSAVENLYDGDATSFWMARRVNSTFPHELVILMPEPVKVMGLHCLPPHQPGLGGGIKDYEVYVSPNGADWGPPLVRGSFPYGTRPHRILFPATIETRYVKLVAVSGFWPRWPTASLAELTLLIAAPGKEKVAG